MTDTLSDTFANALASNGIHTAERPGAHPTADVTVDVHGYGRLAFNIGGPVANATNALTAHREQDGRGVCGDELLVLSNGRVDATWEHWLTSLVRTNAATLLTPSVDTTEYAQGLVMLAHGACNARHVAMRATVLSNLDRVAAFLDRQGLLVE